ncbi:sensor histidine kinase KdpD [Bdellovibrio sp. SKB1291214]|uniref:sensor histidine kinase n=1 Tax=Bdellovibrio sp. SKB1291214 TaxID=1732569 RepID=UPI000B516A7F|nr:sensor histidine kinase KdpD [Bdellovibrio sp. SKB1291214]UYL08180.1 sensor histidine kinase KdpD [Bdellovibrio sp. SKB1291214]
MSDDYRPDPDRILDGIKKAEESTYRGHLRIFFGMCPGVGKTFAMLEAAQEQVRQGLDLVVGVVETHGRKETEALLLGLELIPRKKINYKDSVLDEMDIDAILKRKPEIVLVDELAHSNAPGSRHQKRYQDVLELLDAGIHVYTTVNVQHIESRADLVQQITGVRIFERVPDSVIDQAQQIELVDISAQNLRKRLKEGKVYQGERAAKAGENFFKETHLLALRELALRYTAEKVDQDLQDQMVVQRVNGPWNTQERLLVAVGYSPYSARLIRATRRMAYSLEAPWLALYVDTGEQLASDDQAMLNKNLALARELGAEVVSLRDSNIVEAIHRIANERNVTQIIMGRPVGRWWDFIFRRGSLLDQLVQRASLVDIHIIRQEERKNTKKFRLAPPVLYAPGTSYWNAFWFVGGITFISELLNPYLGYRAVGFIFLLAILLMGFMSTLGPILFAAILSVLVWNFLFIPPLFTFHITAAEDVMMCFAYLFVAMMGGFLTAKIRRRDRDLLQRDQYNRALLELVQDMSTAVTRTEVAFSAEQNLEKILNGKIKILFSDMDGKLERRTYNVTKLDEKDLALALWSFENRKKAGWRTETLTESRCLSLPLKGKNSLEGVMLFYPRVQNPLSLEQDNLIETVALQLGASLERLKLQDTLQNVKLLEASEKLHQALLNSVSHELRTPLTAIIGSASALQDHKLSSEDKVREGLVDSVIESSRRLDQVVENLLDMSRLNSGVLTPKKVWVDLVDFCESLTLKVRPLVAGRTIQFHCAEEICLMQIDEKLMEHVISNLILNAAKYSKPGSGIEVHLSREGRKVQLSVLDEGAGIPTDQLQKIFEAFHRVPGSAASGVGLGLAIVKAFVEAHDGVVYAQNRSDRRGAEFVIELPYEIPPSALTSEDDI